MEHLTKHQIVLLTLLVSFVTSIATGIVTVALMNQAPIGVTQTINHVIERTIEQVTSPATSTQQTGEKETVVVSEDDQVVSAIDKNTASIVRIQTVQTDQTTGATSSVFVSIGAVVSSQGVIAADNGVIYPDGKYFFIDAQGVSHDLTVLDASSSGPIALLGIATTASSSINLLPATLSTQGNLKLGQAVVYVGGKNQNAVATGIVSALNTAGTSASSTPAIVSVNTTLTSANLIPGGILLNLSGELVGIKSSYGPNSSADLFAPVSAVQSELNVVSAAK